MSRVGLVATQKDASFPGGCNEDLQGLNFHSDGWRFVDVHTDSQGFKKASTWLVLETSKLCHNFEAAKGLQSRRSQTRVYK